MIKGKNPPSILPDEASQNFFNHIRKIYIEPEIEKRKNARKINDNFSVYKCLIKMRSNEPVIVQFNEECGFLIVARKDRNISFQNGQKVYTHQIREIVDVMPPEINNNPASFIFLHSVNEEWRIFFDLSLDGRDSSELKNSWGMGKLIANSLQESLDEQTVLITKKANDLLNSIGLWCAPALVSHPLNKIIEQISNADEEGAIETLKEFCNMSFLETLSTNWFDNEIFAKLKTVIQDALKGHKEKLYTIIIPALLLLVEGILTDWIGTQPEGDIKQGQSKKIKQFHDMLLENTMSNSYDIIITSTIDFIQNMVFVSFDWTKNIDTVFPNRHMIGHATTANMMTLYIPK